ncbi:MAG: HYExAFE family protein [Phycisphaerae bacterium]
MARHRVHYEAAFEDYLRARGWPYVVVDEAKKAIFAEVRLKSFDFLVYSESAANLLVDVKGRKFPDSAPGRKRHGTRAWENWITRDDVDGLTRWQDVFGESFRAVLVFAYWLQGPPQRSPFEDIHVFGRRHYAFLAVPLGDYVSAARPRSARWRTLTVPTVRFSRMALNLASLL